MVLMIILVVLVGVVGIVAINRIFYIIKLIELQSSFVVVNGVIEHLQLRTSSVGMRYVSAVKYHFVLDGKTFHSENISPVTNMPSGLATPIGSSIKIPQEGDSVAISVSKKIQNFHF